MNKVSGIVMLGLIVCGNGAFASDADSVDTDFSLRLPAGLAKFSSPGDVAGSGGASTASRYPSGINPASIDWEASADLPWYFSSQWSSIQFDRAPRLDVAAV